MTALLSHFCTFGANFGFKIIRLRTERSVGLGHSFFLSLFATIDYFFLSPKEFIDVDRLSIFVNLIVFHEFFFL